MLWKIEKNSRRGSHNFTPPWEPRVRPARARGRPSAPLTPPAPLGTRKLFAALSRANFFALSTLQYIMLSLFSLCVSMISNQPDALNHFPSFFLFARKNIYGPSWVNTILTHFEVGF